MQFMLLAYVDPHGFAALKPEDAQKAMAAYAAFDAALTKEGAMIASNRLRPTTDATTVRITDGKTRVLNGPYAEAKEELGGYFLIEVANKEAALAWAARCPAASHGIVEVRPVWSM